MNPLRLLFCAVLFSHPFLLAISSAVGQAKKPVESLHDVEVFAAAVGKWKGIGVGFDIEEGEIGEGMTHRDEWVAKFRRNAHVLEMKGVAIPQGGEELPYSWKFRFGRGGRDDITATYEMADGKKGTLAVLLIADGKRVQLKRPKGAREGIDMELDIYFDNEDLVIDTRIRNIHGKEVYRSATRYTRDGSEAPAGKAGKDGKDGKDGKGA